MKVQDLYIKLKKIEETDENKSVLKILIKFVLEKDYALVSQEDIEIEDKNKIEELYKEYLEDKPVQYITKESYFLENKFYVDERVLIPRFATEDVVLKAVEYIDNEIESIADICTGSGVIAVTLKKMFPNIRVIATDISKDALEVCDINRRNIANGVELYQGDLLRPLIENNIKVDMIVSNPPYIEEDYQLDKRVRDYEPKLALYSGKDGTDHYKKILNEVKDVLNPQGIVVFEIGFNQREKLLSIIDEIYKNEVEVEFFKDLEDNDRICVIKFV